jgi:microcystin-dependent protein
MACIDCFNGCVDITTDKCVKFTGTNVPFLNIKKGDTLLMIELSIIDKLLSLSTGIGVIPNIDFEFFCEKLNVIKNSIKEECPYNLKDFLEIILLSICDLFTAVKSIDDFLITLESDYEVRCLEQLQGNEGTHLILQNLINKVCNLVETVTNISTNITNNYIKTNEINNYIEAYLNSEESSILYNSKMIPYAVVEYYGPLNVFDETGKGLLLWDKIYLCNGANNTPDKRGRVAVGVIENSKGGTLSSEVDNNIPGNPNYKLLVPFGSNNTNLTIQQLPSHSHTSIVTINDSGHEHEYTQYTLDQEVSTNGNGVRGLDKNNIQTGSFKTTKITTGITASVDIKNVGGGNAHTNIQPVLPCHYIIYIP